MTCIDRFTVRRFDVDVGRSIGDSCCTLEIITIVEVRLTSTQGHVGCGYAEVFTQGRFNKPAWWISPLPDAAALNDQFRSQWWPHLKGVAPTDTEALRRTYRSSHGALDQATRLALWDLIAKGRDLPLYRCLGGDRDTGQCKAYGSPLDFPLDDAAAEELIGSMATRGLDPIKIKVGAADPKRDLERLHLAQRAAGPKIKICADANEAWDWPTALARLEMFAASGVVLAYIEDPLYRTDYDGLSQLAARSPTPVVGHDYLTSIEDMRRLVDCGIAVLRANGDIDLMLGVISLARRHHLPVYVGNSQFEVNVHIAAAFSCVAQLEFSDLGWNRVVRTPVRFEGGVGYAPDRPGHGIELIGDGGP